jgi:predicted CoA-binding protein
VKTTAIDEIGELLKRTRTIAVVGLSDSPLRPSHGVSAYMQSQGYRIIPVNPEIKGALGEKAVASLSDIREKIDVVDVFRRSEFVPHLVDEAIRLKVPAIWLQEGVIHEEAAEKARKAGILVVMDKCILKEHRARFR